MGANYEKLTLDDQELLAVATIIESYCRSQKEVMDEYKRHMDSLSNEWKDEKTLGTLLLEIDALRNKVTKIMEEVSATYPAKFREKAKFIVENRPKY